VAWLRQAACATRPRGRFRLGALRRGRLPTFTIDIAVRGARRHASLRFGGVRSHASVGPQPRKARLRGRFRLGALRRGRLPTVTNDIVVRGFIFVRRFNVTYAAMAWRRVHARIAALLNKTAAEFRAKAQMFGVVFSYSATTHRDVW